LAVGTMKNKGRASGRNPNKAKRNRTRGQAFNSDAVRDGHGHAIGFGRTAKCVVHGVGDVRRCVACNETKIPWPITPNSMPRSL